MGGFLPLRGDHQRASVRPKGDLRQMLPSSLHRSDALRKCVDNDHWNPIQTTPPVSGEARCRTMSVFASRPGVGPGASHFSRLAPAN